MIIHVGENTEIRKKNLTLKELEKELAREKDRERYHPTRQKKAVKPINHLYS